MRLQGATGSPEAVARLRFPEERSVWFSRTTLFRRGFTALRELAAPYRGDTHLFYEKGAYAAPSRLIKWLFVRVTPPATSLKAAKVAHVPPQLVANPNSGGAHQHTVTRPNASQPRFLPSA